MITYQDLLGVQQTDSARAEFVRSVISEHRNSDLYKTAKTADEYDRCRNTTTMEYQRYITDLTGRKYEDTINAVHRSTSNFFNIVVTQLTQYLLANGVKWSSQRTAVRLGADFDTRLQELAKSALCGGVAFGFYNLDHLEVFPVYSRSRGDFAPLYDEESGALTAGVRSWQIDASKPLRATLYELDGYTDMLWSDTLVPTGAWYRAGDGLYMMRRRPYRITVRESQADGREIYAGEPYPSFPIVPHWGNSHRQSALVGLREKIDAYDFILNGFENDLDNAQIYWIIKGAGGMDDPDLMQFLDRLRTVKAAAPAEGQDILPVEVNIPHEAREKLLDRLERQLYRDAMILNPDDIAAGSATATQIRAAYERQNVKADEFEYCVIEFLNGILKVAGIDDTPTFTRSTIVNVQEEVQTVIQAATYLDSEYVTRKILSLLGDGDQADDVLARMDEESAERLIATPGSTEGEGSEVNGTGE